jgi:hypothetical protein
MVSTDDIKRHNEHLRLFSLTLPKVFISREKSGHDRIGVRGKPLEQALHSEAFEESFEEFESVLVVELCNGGSVVLRPSVEALG